MFFYYFIINEWKYTFEITFTNFIFIEAASAFCMSSNWFVFTTRTPESVSNLTSVFFWIWRLFSWALYSWTLETQGSYIYDCSFVKPDKYSSSEVSLSSFPLFPSSEALFLRWWNLIYLQNLFWSFEFTWYFIWYFI